LTFTTANKIKAALKLATSLRYNT